MVKVAFAPALLYNRMKYVEQVLITKLEIQMGSGEAIQQLLLILIPGIVLALINSVPRERGR